MSSQSAYFGRFTMKRISWVFCSIVLAILISGLQEEAPACNPDKPISVTVAPADEIRIQTGGKKAEATLSTLVSCQVDGTDWTSESTLSNGGAIEFNVRLVDEDGALDPDDTVHTVKFRQTVRRQITSFARRVEKALTFTIKCNDSLNISNEEDTGEGSDSDPADLVHEVDHGQTQENTNHSASNRTSSTLDGVCVAAQVASIGSIDQARESFQLAAASLQACEDEAAALRREGVDQRRKCSRSAIRAAIERIRNGDRYRTIKRRRTRGDKSHSCCDGQTTVKKVAQKKRMPRRKATAKVQEEGRVAQEAPVGTMQVDGDGAWVSVSGPVMADGTFVAEGTGTVAGFPNVRVTFEGKYHLGMLSGAYSLGVGGELPGGQPIIYDIEAPLDDWQAIVDELSPSILAAAEAMGALNQETPVGGIDVSQHAVAITGGLLSVWQALQNDALDGDFELPEREPDDPAAEALTLIENELTLWAQETAASTHPSRAALEQALNDAALAFGQAAAARAEMHLNTRPPTEGDGETTEAWIDAMVAAGAALDQVGATLLGGPFATVSGASFVGPVVAASQIVSGFGAGMTPDPFESATSTPLPTTLAGLSVRIVDALGAEHDAGLFFGSGSQINYYIPPEVAPGEAVVMVMHGGELVASGTLQVDAVAPSLFSANANGAGVAAAVALRVAGDGTQTSQLIFEAANGGFGPVSIDLGPESDQVILLLFGTGIRGGQNIEVRIGGEVAPVLGFAPSPEFVGLDQVNVRIPRSLIGRGAVDIEVLVDGFAANIVQMAVL